MIRRREPTANPQTEQPEARNSLVLRTFEDRSSDEKLEFVSPPRKSPLANPETKNRSGTYDYFGSISGVFAKTDSHAKVRFEEFFKSPNATPMKDKQISSFTKGAYHNHSSDKKKSSEKHFKLQLDSVRVELDFPVPSRITLASKHPEDDLAGSNHSEKDPALPGSQTSCAICKAKTPPDCFVAQCCKACVCHRCEVRFYHPQIAVRGAACPFCVGGKARSQEEDWCSL